MHRRDCPTAPFANRMLAHPLWWTALAVLVVNDHILKGSGLEPIVTGKLSDIAGMLVAPALLAAIVRARSRRVLLLCHFAVALVFSAINLSTQAAASWTAAFEYFGIPWRVWSDPSDLVALPMLAISWILITRSARSPTPSTHLQRIAVALGSVACIASSPWPVARPTIVDGRVLVEHQQGVMFVVDSDSGAVLRTLLASGHNDAPPAIHDRILYQVQDDGRITGIHIDNPQEPFTLWTSRSSWTRIIHVDDHRIYFVTVASETQLHAIDRVFGRKVWSQNVSNHDLRDLAAAGDTLLISDDERVRAINARTGQELWSFDAAEPVGSPAVQGNVAYVASAGGVVRGLSLSSGREMWRFEGRDEACDTYAPHVYLDGDTVFACIDGSTIAVSIQSRKERWTNEDEVVGAGSGVALLRHGSDAIVGVEAVSGRQKWTVTFDDSLWTRPVIDSGTAYARNHVGKLYAVNLSTGHLRWTLDMDDAHTVVAMGGPSLVIASR